MPGLQESELFQTGYLVNGQWKTLDTTFDVVNPATGEVIAKVAKAGKQQTEEAIAAAANAFPAWREKTAKERSTILYRWYELILENKSWLGRLMTIEQGKKPKVKLSTPPALFSGLRSRPNALMVRLSLRLNQAREFSLPVNLLV